MKTRTRIVFAHVAIELGKAVSLYRVVDANRHSLFGPARWKACVAWRKRQAGKG